MDNFNWNLLSGIVTNLLHQTWQSLEPLPKDEVTPTDNFIVVFRHGESDDNANMQFSGWRDPHITEIGKKQASKLKEKLKHLPINIVVTSDLIRSVETAQYAFEGNTEVKFETDARIKERNYGDLQGQNKLQTLYENPEDGAQWRRGYDFPPPNGESMKMVEERVVPFLEELVGRIKREKINVALSVHGNSMRAIRKYFENMTIEQMTTHENPMGTDYALYVVK